MALCSAYARLSSATLCSKMSVDNSQVVDAIGTEKDDTVVTLTITDHLEWGNVEHLLKLQNKLNKYLAFIESGEIYDAYPSAKGKKIQISVVCKYDPDNEGFALLEQCKKQIEKAGFHLRFETHGT